MNCTLFIPIGGVLAALAVGLGALGAHALKSQLEPQQLETYHTAVQYQMYHAIGLVLVGLLGLYHRSRWFDGAGWSMLVGIVLFSEEQRGGTKGGTKGSGVFVSVDPSKSKTPDPFTPSLHRPGGARFARPTLLFHRQIRRLAADHQPREGQQPGGIRLRHAGLGLRAGREGPGIAHAGAGP